MTVQLNVEEVFEQGLENVLVVMEIAKEVVQLNLKNAKINNVQTLLKSLIGRLG